MEIPSWIQEFTVFAVGLVSVIIGLYKYFTTQAKPNKPEDIHSTQVVAASFVDSKLLRELIDVLKESQEEGARIAARVTRSNSDLREALIDASESSKLDADATLNLIRFLRTQLKGETHEFR